MISFEIQKARKVYGYKFFVNADLVVKGGENNFRLSASFYFSDCKSEDHMV